MVGWNRHPFAADQDVEFVRVQHHVAAGVGLTMTAARYCVLGEISWTPATNDQAIDRVHRLTQLRQVEAPIITFPHAVEERVIRANAKKAISAQNILDRNLMSLFAA